MLYDLIKIGVYTGASIEEIYSEKVVDIVAESFTIKDSKTLLVIDKFQFMIS